MLESFQASQRGPTVQFRLPPATFFRLPDPNPASLTPPQNERSWAQPFQIAPDLYTKLLDYRVPITIATVYATTVVVLNRVNKRRGYKPWAISRTSLFKLLVILHNVFLAVYSAWTCVGMYRALRQSIPSAMDHDGIVGVVDAFCKVAGPRGLGNGAMYNVTTDQWVLPNPEYQLAANGSPDPTDAGRMWNQGLAYFGWLFYLSKFYEVIDTAIILAKGKKSSTLQTYHHAGAMMCMWAGIRFMGPPIWIFVLINSFIHALMYTYYTLTALGVRVPNQIKRALTTMQISQFVFGTFAASAYMFVRYSIPITVSRGVSWDHLSPAIPSATSTAESGVVAAATVSAGLVPWLKKLAFRAAGAEGIAENVLNAQGQPFGPDAAHAAQFSQATQQMIHTVQYKMIDCVDTSGQAFAIWLNVGYLLPLTYLFARFFVRSYLQRKEPVDLKKQKPATQIHLAEQAGLDALKGVSREIRRAVMEMNGDGDTSATDEESVVANLQGKLDSAKQKILAEKAKRSISGDNDSSSSNNEDRGGFSTVPPKRAAKQKEAEKSAGGPASPVKPSNTFDVLKDETNHSSSS